MKDKERKILLRRFFYNDRRLYNLGKATGIKWFDKFDYKFDKDEYAYFATEEKEEALEELTNPKVLNDEEFVSGLNKVGPPEYMQIDRFVGRYYYFNAREEGTFKLDDRRADLRRDVQGMLDETSNRAYYFLKAIISLYRDGRWDKAYRGATWIDILAEIRDIKGAYPAPRDIAIIKSYRTYYKTGSRRYPTHTVPEEMISTIEETLENVTKSN